MSNLERLLTALIDDSPETVTDIIPQTNMEHFLKECVDKVNCGHCPKPISRVDILLEELRNKLINGGGGETNKLVQLVDNSITTLTAEDLAGATSIKTYSFFKCTNLTSIIIPNSITVIDSYAFSNCINLTSVILPNSVTELDDYAFADCESLPSIILPNSITVIGSYAFIRCKSLTSVTLPNNILRLYGTFRDCINLPSVIIPNSVTELAYQAFFNCKSFTSITIPSGVTKIGNGVFSNCTSLTSITIPSGVTELDSYALSMGTIENKATITMLPITPPSIQNNTFDTDKLNQIIVPAGTGDTYKAATNWSNLADYIVEATE